MLEGCDFSRAVCMTLAYFGWQQGRDACVFWLAVSAKRECVLAGDIRE